MRYACTCVHALLLWSKTSNLISKNTVKARVWTKLKPVRAQTKLTD